MTLRFPARKYVARSTTKALQFKTATVLHETSSSDCRLAELKWQACRFAPSSFPCPWYHDLIPNRGKLSFPMRTHLWSSQVLGKLLFHLHSISSEQSILHRITAFIPHVRNLHVTYDPRLALLHPRSIPHKSISIQPTLHARPHHPSSDTPPFHTLPIHTPAVHARALLFLAPPTHSHTDRRPLHGPLHLHLLLAHPPLSVTSQARWRHAHQLRSLLAGSPGSEYLLALWGICCQGG